MVKRGSLVKDISQVMQEGKKLEYNGRNSSVHYCKLTNSISTIETLLFVMMYLCRSPASFKGHKQSVDRADP